MDILNKKQFVILVLTAIGIWAPSAHAQTSDRFSIYYEQLADADDVSTSSVVTRLGHQFIMDEEGSNLLTLGVNYTEVNLTDEDITGPDQSRLLRSLVPEANFMRIMDEEYSLVVIFRPGFYGDFKGGFADDFRLEGGALVTKVMTDSLTMGLGVGRGTNFGRDLIVPLVQFLYFASDKILVRGILPTRASIWYIPNQKWEFGGNFRLTGALYQLENSSLPEVEKVGFAAANLGAAVRRNVMGKSWVVLEAGLTMMRRYEWRGDDGPSFISADDPDFDRDLGSVPYVRVGWQHRL